MTTYLVTGGTGFLGRHLLRRLTDRPDAVVHVLVRPSSAARLERLAASLPGGAAVRPLLGDIRSDDLGIAPDELAALRGQVDHVVHLAALYDMTADAADNEDLNVGGTRRALDVARTVGGTFHHVSSVAVAGEHLGVFTEDMFDEGQDLASPYHRTKFEAERLVRDSGLPWRVYRPSIVVGDSRTGEMDKVDGPYYFLPFLKSVGSLPLVGRVPLVLPDLGDTNVVPVDHVADAMDALVHADGLDGRAFHLGHPRMQPLLDVYNALARATGAPQVAVHLTRSLLPPAVGLLGQLGRLPGVQSVAEVAAARLGIPPSVIPHSTFRPVFLTDKTRQVLDGLGVPPPPELEDYADVLVRYWADHLDPLRARRREQGESPLHGRTVVVTGASSGIGKATALEVARRGGIPLLLARRLPELEEVRDEIVAAGGRADVYSVDLTDPDSIDACVKQMLSDHEGIDMLVNNAGRSIRRSIKLSYDRFHDFERTMSLNYFAPVRLVLALLPHMTSRRFGHIVNVSSIGVQTNPPRFSAYVGSKAALDAFSRVAATELVGDGVTFTNVHMPLVRTPMIAPTTLYDRFPTLSPEQAADLIVGALEDQPKHVGTKLGTTAVVATALAPKLVDAVLHTAYHLFPDSTAAGGDKGSRTDAPEALSRGAVVLSRLLPGVHW